MFVIEVPSSEDGKKHTVRKAGQTWVCSCRDHVHRSNGERYTCRHIATVAKSLIAHITESELSKTATRILSDPEA